MRAAVLAVVSVVLCTGASASARPSAWASLGGGCGYFSEPSFTGIVSGNLQWRRVVAAVHAVKSNESGMFEIFISRRPLIRVSDIGGMLGVSIVKNEWIHFNALAGLSSFCGHRRGRLDATISADFLFEEELYEKREFRVPGVPVQANILFVKNGVVGFGGTLHANLNSELSTVGIYLSLVLGKLK